MITSLTTKGHRPLVETSKATEHLGHFGILRTRRSHHENPTVPLLWNHAAWTEPVLVCTPPMATQTSEGLGASCRPGCSRPACGRRPHLPAIQAHTRTFAVRSNWSDPDWCGRFSS